MSPDDLPSGLGDLYAYGAQDNAMRRWQEEQDRTFRENLRAIEEGNAEKERQRQEVELRENRLAAIAEEGRRRELRGEKRERLLLIIALATLLVSIVAAVAATLALTK